jgi:aminopeptidase
MTRAGLRHGAAALAIALASACGQSEAPPSDRGDLVLEHVKTFAALDHDGGTPDDADRVKAMEYVQAYLTKLGLKATIVPVPLIRMRTTALTVRVQGPNGIGTSVDAANTFFQVWPGQQQGHVSVDAGIVFAGYGIVSREFERDDYKQIDVSGKIVMIREGFPDTTGRPDLTSLGRTYYGTSAYKFSEAARRGAVAAVIVEADGQLWGPAAAAAAGAAPIDIDSRATGHDEDPNAEIEGWLSRAAATRLCQLAGVKFEDLVKHSDEPAFQPVVLPDTRLAIDLTSDVDHFTSHDVIAVLPGRTPEYVLVAGRWNRLPAGIWADPSLETTTTGGVSTEPAIRRSVADDGSGAALVLDTARRLVADGSKPLRSVVFMVTTALDGGTMGLEHYIENPPASMPLDKLAALIFVDHGDLTGDSQRVGKVGIENDAAISQVARGAAMEQGRPLELDGNDARRYYYAFDQVELRDLGVRALYLTTQTAGPRGSHARIDQANRDRVLGLPEPPRAAAAAGPGRDVRFLTALVQRVGNATNWPPRIDVLGLPR